jgi:hypothetical protein
MIERKINKINSEPPLAHAKHIWNKDTGELVYEYNGRNIIYVKVLDNTKLYFRIGSDGNLQNMPLIQQIFIASEEETIAEVQFNLSNDVLNMKPNRAENGKAIIGQIGRPLLYGVNGIYDINQDLLIEWYGCSWQWLKDRFVINEDGEYTAKMKICLRQTPLIINLKMQYYRMHLGYSYYRPWEKRPKLDSITGWCSWEAYRDKVSENDIKYASEFLGKALSSYGLDYIQIDDGFQQSFVPMKDSNMVADSWLNTNEKFPRGHEYIVKNIKENGLKPGVWTNAVVNNEAFANNSSACIKDIDEKALKGSWINYILNCDQDTLREQVLPYYKGLKVLGYQYFKTDAIRHLWYDGLMEAVRRGIITNNEADKKFRAFLECAREGIGEDAYLLSCWGVLSQAVGIADACRVATDSNPSWRAIYMQIVESGRWFNTQRILFLNDPDHICVRTEIEWARTILSLVSLSGGLFMLSDSINNYDEQRLKMIKQCIPSLTTYTAETGQIDLSYGAFARGEYKAFSTLWSFHFQTEYRTWCVLGRFATVNLKQEQIPLENLSLNPEIQYIAFDFWIQNFLGIVSNNINCKELIQGNCQIIGLTPLESRPQIIASSRHVSMDIVSVKNELWKENVMHINLDGVKDTTETYYFHVPEGYEFKYVKSHNLDVCYEFYEEILKLSVFFTEHEGEIDIYF